MSTAQPHRNSARRAARGLSIVELMIGVTISLFILAGATMVLTSQMGDNRRLLLEAQMQQDLRTAADMISRDIRRAGYWGQAYRGVCPPPPTVCAVADPLNANPYNGLTTVGVAGSATQLNYARSTDEEAGAQIGTDDGVLDGGGAGRPREQVGFRWNAANKTIDFQVGNWQTLTDASVLRVTQFTMNYAYDDVAIPCGTGPCLAPFPPQPAANLQALGPTGCRLFLRSRNVGFTIVAQAVHDSAVKRSLSDNVRLRNAIPLEKCAP